jgi:hypothetical protein
MAFIKGNAVAESFLTSYWAAQMSRTPMEIQEFQKEVATLTAPKNKSAELRLTLEDYIPTNNPPKPRDEPEFELEDLEVNPEASPIWSIL